MTEHEAKIADLRKQHGGNLSSLTDTHTTNLYQQEEKNKLYKNKANKRNKKIVMF